MIEKERRDNIIKNHLLKQLFLVILGTFIAALGVRLIVISGLGADAISTLVLGIIQHVPLQFGTVSMLFNGIVLILVFIYDRKMIGFGSVINSFGLGLCLNILEWLNLLRSVPTNMSYLSIVIGAIVFGIGTGVYLFADAGSAAYESLMIILKRVLKSTIKTARVLLDAAIYLIGFLLGGKIGVGTLIVLVLMGPSLEVTLKQLTKFNFFQLREIN